MKRTLVFLALIIITGVVLYLPPHLQAASNVSGGLITSRRFQFNFTANDDDGGGRDYVCVVCYNEDGTVNDVDISSFTTGTSALMDRTCNATFKAEVLSLRVAFFDLSSAFTGDEDTGAGLEACLAAGGPGDGGPGDGGTTPDREPDGAAALLPGCDVTMDIPPTAVVGAFVDNAPLYWAPGQLTSPLVTIPAGKTAWVLGQDTTGEYYQIIWVCNLLWVPEATMGPNYDSVWNGAPLPTTVVD